MVSYEIIGFWSTWVTYIWKIYVINPVHIQLDIWLAGQLDWPSYMAKTSSIRQNHIVRKLFDQIFHICLDYVYKHYWDLLFCTILSGPDFG